MSTQQPGVFALSIHLVNGHTLNYSCSGERSIDQALGISHPSRTFADSHITIDQEEGVVALRMLHVLRIDIAGTPPAGWTFLHGTSLVRQISKATFEETYNAASLAAHRGEAGENPGTLQVGYVLVDLIDGSRLHWEVVLESQQMLPNDFEPYIGKLMEAHGLHALIEGGVTIVNPAHIVALTFLPGPPQTIPRSWKLNAG